MTTDATMKARILDLGRERHRTDADITFWTGASLSWVNEVRRDAGIPHLPATGTGTSDTTAGEVLAAAACPDGTDPNMPVLSDDLRMAVGSYDYDAEVDAHHDYQAEVLGYEGMDELRGAYEEASDFLRDYDEDDEDADHDAAEAHTETVRAIDDAYTCHESDGDCGCPSTIWDSYRDGFSGALDLLASANPHLTWVSEDGDIIDLGRVDVIDTLGVGQETGYGDGFAVEIDQGGTVTVCGLELTPVNVAYAELATALEELHEAPNAVALSKSLTPAEASDLAMWVDEAGGAGYNDHVDLAVGDAIARADRVRGTGATIIDLAETYATAVNGNCHEYDQLDGSDLLTLIHGIDDVAVRNDYEGTVSLPSAAVTVGLARMVERGQLTPEEIDEKFEYYMAITNSVERSFASILAE